MSTAEIVRDTINKRVEELSKEYLIYTGTYGHHRNSFNDNLSYLRRSIIDLMENLKEGEIISDYVVSAGLVDYESVSSKYPLVISWIIDKIEYSTKLMWNGRIYREPNCLSHDTIATKGILF